MMPAPLPAKDADEIFEALADIDAGEILADTSEIDELMADTELVSDALAEIDADRLLRSIG